MVFRDGRFWRLAPLSTMCIGTAWALARRQVRARRLIVVVCGSDAVSDFDRLRASMRRGGSREAFLYAFRLPSWTAGTCARAHGWPAERPRRWFSGWPALACSSPSTSKARTALPRIRQRPGWGWKASF